MKAKREKYRSGEKALTKAQVQQFLAVITDIRDLALFETAISIGLRREDLVNVMKKDVDLQTKTLTHYERKKKRTRSVPIPQKLCNTIEMVLRAFPKEKDGRLFPISSKTAYNKLQMYLARAGLPNRPIHALRATCIKLCQSNGWSAEQTAELVGDEVQTIQEHYLTPSVEEMKAMMDKRSVI